MKVWLLAYLQPNHDYSHANRDNPLVPDLADPSEAAVAERLSAGTAEFRGPEKIVEYAARTCYAAENGLGKNPAYIQARIRQGHDSVIEHASFTFRVEGISRTCLAQLTRHRIASYSVRSMRFVEEKDAAFVVPGSLHDVPWEVSQEAMKAVRQAQRAYANLVASGMPKEDARLFLPLGTPTIVVLTMNARALRHFFSVRLDSAAQWEIRELARQMLKLVRGVAPKLFEDIEETDETSASAAAGHNG